MEKRERQRRRKRSKKRKEGIKKDREKRGFENEMQSVKVMIFISIRKSFNKAGILIILVKPLEFTIQK